jgi:PST family polysaccharide transporter
MILARLLSPSDFGLVAMVTAFTNFVATFRDGGLAMATVQRDEVNHAQVSTLFWGNVALALLLGAAVACSAPAVAWLYGRDELVPITALFSLSIIVGGFAVQHRALLSRQMRFTALVATQIGALIGGIIVGVAMALAGMSYWSLVGMALAISVLDTLGVWVACPWMPGPPVRRSGVRSMARFGGYLSIANTLNWACQNVDNVLIGISWGAAPLGIYTRAYQVVLLPMRQINGPITAVVLPGLSRLQSDPAGYRALFVSALASITLFGIPIVALAACEAEAIVLTILGPKWGAAAPVFRYLAPAAAIATFHVATGWTFVSLGRVDRNLRVVVVRAAATIAAFAAGLPWGPAGVALAYSVTLGGAVIPEMVYAFHGTPIVATDVLRALWRPVLASTLAAGAVLLSPVSLLPLQSTALLLLLKLVIFVAVYLCAVALLPGGRELLTSLLRPHRLLDNDEPAGAVAST